MRAPLVNVTMPGRLPGTASPAEGQDFGKYRRELAPTRQRPHMLTGATGPDLAKYRMHIFKTGP